MRVSRFLSTIIILGCMAGALPSAFAQDEGDRPRRGGGQGGGPGGGQGGGRGGMRMGGMMGGGMMGGGLVALIAMKEVREELKLDADQTKELEEAQKAIGEEMRAEMEKLRGDGGGNGGPPRFDPEKMRSAMEAMAAKVEAKLSDTLDPKQLDRLIGLALQQNTVRALSVKLIASRLSITDEQKSKMTEIEAASGEEMRSLFGGGPPGPEIREKMTKLREESEAKVLALLTDKQKSEIETLKGEKFTFPERQGFGPGGPGGPGGGPGGPGGGRGRRGGDGT